MKPFRFGLIIGLLALAGASSLWAQDVFRLYLREYARTENNDKVVGDGGRLKVVEDAEGEQIEVVEFAVPRAKQREQDLCLFTTVPPKDRPKNNLTRTYAAWVNGAVKELTFQEPDEIDRTLYRRGSAAYDTRVAALFETARLNALLGKLAWFVRQAEAATLPRVPLARAVAANPEFPKLRQYQREQERLQLYLRGLLFNLDRIPALNTDIAASQKSLVGLRTRQAALATELAALEKKLAGRHEPRGDPDIRRRDIVKIEEYEARADIRFEENAVATHQATIAAIGIAAVEAVAPPVAPGTKKEDKEKAATVAPPAPAELPKLRDQVAQKLQAVDAWVRATGDLPAFLVAAAQETATLMTAFAAQPDLEEKGKKLAQAWPQAVAGKALDAEMTELLATWAKAVAAIPVVDYGRYQVTLTARLQGVPQCVGTPIVVSAGGMARRFYSYQWPDAEAFHPQTFDVELRESRAHMLALDLPTGRGGWGLCGSLDAYNTIRLKGWQLTDETTFLRLAEAMFVTRTTAPPAPEQVVAGYLQELYAANGTFDVSVTLEQSRRNGVKTERGMGMCLGGPDASLDSLCIDYVKIEKVPEPGLVLRQVLVQKNWIKPGWDNRFMGWIHNRTDKELTGRLKTTLVAEFDSGKAIDERDVTVAPRSSARVVVPWVSAANEPWFGREVKMELTDAAGTTRAADTFTIHPNCFPISIAGGPMGYDVYRGPKSFKNNIETFGITHGDSVCVLQNDVLAPVPSGMSNGAPCHVPFLRAGAQANHQLGIGYTYYLSPLCTGSESYRQYLLHPEWWPGRLEWTEQMNDNWNTVTRLYRERFYADGGFDNGAVLKEFPLLHLEQPVNHGCRDLFDRLVEDMITYNYLVDWDGTRWDGGPLSVFSQDFLGRPFKHYKTGEPLDTAMKCKQLGAEFFREMKERLKKHHPRWVYGNNGDSDGYGGTLINLEKDPPDVKDYPQFVEFMKDNGAYMDEGWMSAYLFGDTRNKLERYLKICFKESMLMKKYSGNLWTFSPERDGSPYFNVDFIYYTILPYLCGATYVGAISPTPWSTDGPAYFFTRFGDYFLDYRWQAYPDAADRINVDAGNVWAAEVATWRKLADNRVQVVLPVINRHPRERFMETQNRFSELPSPVKGTIAVSVKAPPGFENVTPEVWDLNCEPVTAAKRLQATAKDGTVRFELAGLNLFKVAVLDFRRAP